MVSDFPVLTTILSFYSYLLPVLFRGAECGKSILVAAEANPLEQFLITLGSLMIHVLLFLHSILQRKFSQTYFANHTYLQLLL